MRARIYGAPWRARAPEEGAKYKFFSRFNGLLFFPADN